MEFSLLTFIALVIIIAITVLVIISERNKLIKTGKDLDSVSTLITLTNIALPALRAGFDVALAERKADEGGFEAVKAATIQYVLSVLEEAGYANLDAEELDYVLEQCNPLLETLWKYKIEIPNKNISPKTLKEIRADLKAE